MKNEEQIKMSLSEFTRRQKMKQMDRTTLEDYAQRQISRLTRRCVGALLIGIILGEVVMVLTLW